MDKEMKNEQDVIKEKAFRLLCEIDCICRKNKIRYFVYAGTLLGAVRHQGFIPWDDDIDIVMFRSEYDRFIEVCETQLDAEKYFLQTIYSDPLTSNPWAKFHDVNTTFISGVRRNGTAEGINIDIFPVDNVPDNQLVQNVRGKLIDKLNFIYQYRFQEHFRNASLKMKLFQWAIGLIPPWNEFQYKNKYDRYIQKYNKNQTKNVVYLSNRRYKRKIIPKEWLMEQTEVLFEGKMFPAPKEWDKILTGLYGKNYMQLPPKADRVTAHGAKIIDVNNSWRLYNKDGL